jgi:gliding motility-associated-like protein
MTNDFMKEKLKAFVCDPTGINCQDCSPNGGIFNVTTLSICKGDPVLKNPGRIQFPVFIPDTSKYDYKYIVSSNDTIISILPVADLSTFPAGDYQLCGISYLRADSFKLPAIGSSLSVFKNNLVTNINGFCAELSKNCVLINIIPSYNGDIIKRTICKGDSIRIAGSWRNTSGLYPVVAKTHMLCDSNIIVDLEVVEVDIISASLDTLDCFTHEVALDISNSIFKAGTQMQWSTSNGRFTDLSNPLKAVVDRAGIYKIVFVDGKCRDSSEIEIFIKDDLPKIHINPETITCLKKSIHLVASTDAKNAQFRWTDGITNLGIDSTLMVNVPGVYLVYVTDEVGCTHSDSVRVGIDTVRAKLKVYADKITCRFPQAQLYFQTNDSLIDRFWQGPNLFNSKMDTAMVSDTGWYSLLVQSANGCFSSDSIKVLSDIRIPDFWILGDTVLNCTNLSKIILNVGSSFEIDSILINGPGSYTSNVLNPEINLPGIYKVLLKDTAGCALDTFFTIGIDTAKARFTLSGSQLDCKTDSVQLDVIFGQNDTLNQIQWTGPVGFNSNSKNPFVKEAGLYTVNVTSQNGCISVDTITIMQDDQKPSILLTADVINCTNTETRIQTSVSDGILFRWTGPGGFNSLIKEPMVQDSGLYRLVVTASNGCTAERSIRIAMDKTPPIDVLITDTISCTDESVPLIVKVKVPVDSVSWRGPLNYSSKRDSNLVKTPGVYTVIVKAKNGCIDSASILVTADTSIPVISISSDTLICSNPTAFIRINSNDTTYNYVWQTPKGDTIRSREILTSIPGRYRVYVTGSNGCVKSDSIDLIDKRSLPKFSFGTDSLSCNDTIAELHIATFEGILNINWNGPNNFISQDSIIQTSISGWYYYTVENEFGCILQDSFYVKNYRMKPQVVFSNPVIDCSTLSNPQLHAFFMDSIEDFSWRTPGGLIYKSRSITLTESGDFIFMGSNKFGCITEDTLKVDFDTIPPFIRMIHLDTLDCLVTQVIPVLETNPATVNFRWKGPGGFTSNQFNPVLKMAGLYTITLSAANHCIFDTIVELIVDTIPPFLTVQNAEINCKTDSISLAFSTNDILESVFWQNTKGELLTGSPPVVVDSGWYTIIAVGRNHCLSLDSMYVYLNTIPPDIIFQNGIIPCNPDSVQITFTTKDSLMLYSWRGPNGFVSNEKNPFVRDSGVYVVTVTGANYCEHTDSLIIKQSLSNLQLKIQADTITCRDSIAQLSLSTSSQLLKFLWQGPGLQDSITINPKVKVAGNYILSIVDIHHCKKDTFFDVVADTIRPGLQIVTMDSIVCERKNASLYNLFDCANCVYNWNTSNGIILQNKDRDTVKVSGAGMYSLQLTDTLNGCSIAGEYRLVELNSDLREITANIINPNCFGNTDGEFEIQSILGGRPPFRYSIDGINYSGVKKYTNKASGIYSIYIKDNDGCVLDTTLRLTDPPLLQLNVGRDTTIRLGQSILIQGKVNTNTNSLRQLFWEPDSDLDCKNCLEVMAMPVQNTRYVLTIIDENGCKAVDDIIIQVTDKPTIFIPNAFSPNQDHINDFLIAVSPDEVVNIQFFKVFDRWGNQIFSNSNIELLNQVNLWDGQSNGRPVIPGVYIYQIGFNLINGRQFIQSGEINLIR